MIELASAQRPSSNAGASASSNQASQPGSSSLRRGGIGLCAIVLGAAYVARAAGDLAENGLVWLSPIGWAQATRAYVDERWWPLLLSMAVAALLVTIAVALSARRDLGAGISPERRGPSAASRSLGSPLGLVFRLQRGSVLGWGAVIVLFGVGYGTFLGEAEEFASENEAVRDFLGADASTVLSEAFAAAIALMIALLATAFAIQSALRLSGEETSGRAEPLLATALPRWRRILSHLAVALVAGSAMLVLAGAGMGVTASISTQDSGWAGAIALILAGLRGFARRDVTTV